MSSNSAGSWTSGYTTKSAHSAQLPSATGSVHTSHNTFGNDIGFGAAFLFYKGGTYHYATCGSGPRFECDDYPNDDDERTNHNVYVSFADENQVSASWLFAVE